MVTIQTIAQKRAEVTFRTLMSEQHRGRRVHFADELTQPEMQEELHKRLAFTRSDFARLKHMGIPMNPYLEIGAEYGLRASLIESEFEARGVALDIAHVPLTHLPWFADKFKLKKIPVRICADSHTLPFPDESFPFIFCYQTLHHFPNPLPIIQEIYRCVEPGGYFFFAEEPISQKYNLDLFRRPTKTKGLLRLLKIIPLLPFVSKIGKTETAFGIYEGTISIQVWRKIIEIFTLIDVQIDAFPFGHLTSSISFSKWSWTQFVLDIFGGGIQALLQKPITHNRGQFKRNQALRFTCPDCHSILIQNGRQFVCNKDSRTFGKKNGVLELLPIHLHTSLYAKST